MPREPLTDQADLAYLTAERAIIADLSTSLLRLAGDNGIRKNPGLQKFVAEARTAIAGVLDGFGPDK